MEDDEAGMKTASVYDALNRMTRAWNSKGQESDYFYNGLGQRLGRTINGEEEDYLLDLSKPYHNLLGIRKGDSRQNFYFDNNVSVIEEEGNPHYYLQDELGSPLRISGYGAGKETADIRNEYLTYGYDEFGNDLYKELEEAGIPCPLWQAGRRAAFWLYRVSL
ncbi:MAG: hypothetical protein HDR23_06845 [Lachnospiraceae bacterium]|nr:hypothetical protein [Lachnospiraceae bacterium]